jgi:hypothetical protein
MILVTVFLSRPGLRRRVLARLTLTEVNFDAAIGWLPGTR